ncbi:uncharacterized protein LOC116030698 [Ipomoea triloba]|uniref:uncharacterized protein LOC116030698 n=1 Tax=Ipomoea triloba TaxID=35885 RepID=UPI00125CFA56|nr:uncharacterized protein LOC116030698 [Ipomoea triloba]
MAAPPSQFLLLICTIFIFLVTSSRAGDAAQANSDTPNVVYSDQNAAASSSSTSLNVSPGPTSEAPNAVTVAGAGAGGDTTGLDVGSFKSVPTVKDTPAVNMFVQSTMQKSMTKTENFIDDVIEKRLADPGTDAETKDCLNTCKESYALSMNAMKKTMEDVNDGNLYKANVDVSAMASHADTCKECMRQVYGDDDPEFKKFEAWIDGVTDDCLNKITGLKNNQ